MYVRHVITWRKPIAACAEIAYFLAICEEIAFFPLSKHGQNSAWPWSFRTKTLYSPFISSPVFWPGLACFNSPVYYGGYPLIFLAKYINLDSYSPNEDSS